MMGRVGCCPQDRHSLLSFCSSLSILPLPPPPHFILFLLFSALTMIYAVKNLDFNQFSIR